MEPYGFSDWNDWGDIDGGAWAGLQVDPAIAGQAAAWLHHRAPTLGDQPWFLTVNFVREIGALIAVLGGLDMLVFTAGVGEHNAFIRERICAALGFLGIALDTDANASHAATISTDHSQVLVAIEPTNEEWIAANHALSGLDREKVR